MRESTLRVALRADRSELAPAEHGNTLGAQSGAALSYAQLSSQRHRLARARVATGRRDAEFVRAHCAASVRMRGRASHPRQRLPRASREPRSTAGQVLGRHRAEAGWAAAAAHHARPPCQATPDSCMLRTPACLAPPRLAAVCALDTAALLWHGRRVPRLGPRGSGLATRLAGALPRPPVVGHPLCLEPKLLANCASRLACSRL